MTLPDEQVRRVGYAFDDDIPQDIRVVIGGWAEKHDLKLWRVWWYELTRRQKVRVLWTSVCLRSRLLGAWLCGQR